ncbi:hypothetical protein V6N12_069279 [Hibiscus sabdariffa]|uniref:Uncharacterized protein n=1 Tax=Hibiscus sabdariffa TaxID=183260 RepID=A0ABR2FDD0_9ROSI
MMPSTGREYFTGLFRDWSEVHSDLTRVDDFREWVLKLALKQRALRHVKRHGRHSLQMSSSRSVCISDRIDLPVDCDTENLVGHGLDMEDDVWTTTVSRLGLVDDLVGWGFVQTKLVVEDVWADVATRMKLVDDQPVFGYV